MHPFEDEFRLAGDVPESEDAISFTGTDIQKRIRAPEIRIDTTTLTPDEAAQEVMLFISRLIITNSGGIQEEFLRAISPKG